MILSFKSVSDSPTCSFLCNESEWGWMLCQVAAIAWK